MVDALLNTAVSRMIRSKTIPLSQLKSMYLQSNDCCPSDNEDHDHEEGQSAAASASSDSGIYDPKSELWLYNLNMMLIDQVIQMTVYDIMDDCIDEITKSSKSAMASKVKTILLRKYGAKLSDYMLKAQEFEVSNAVNATAVSSTTTTTTTCPSTTTS
jgi:hypothetical protein